ncbi:MAG: S8 family serine peptidase [Phycisphaerales bacterium]
MAVTDTSLVLSDGEPTSWSSALDQLSWNDGQTTRLMCVSAGNLREALAPGYAYRATNCDAASCIEDPSQSWNALTVGAYTARATITLPDYQNWHPLAPAGGLCPASRTTVAWDDDDRSDWPFKPDIVMEGGNWGTDPAGNVDRLVETSLLTTSMARTGRLLDINCETSGATALAARAAAVIKAAYPTLRWETIRALLVHSAEWTQQMHTDCPGEQRRDVIRRLRMFGYGVPDIGRALWSVNNAVTLVAEQTIQPYYLHEGEVRSRHMTLHNLPWPRQLLHDLGDTPVILRATLSYFIEPSPGRRGWTNSFRYASHGLRFDLKRADETTDAFKARLSADVDAAEEEPGSDGGRWVVGKQARSRGSLHSDWWHGTAAELADRDALAVYPVTGWWRDASTFNVSIQSRRTHWW